MTLRTYILIGLGTGIIVFLIASFGGDAIINILNDMRNQVSPDMQGIAGLIVEPLKLVFGNPLIGAIVVALGWPIAAVWIGLLLILVILIALSQGLGSARSSGVIE
jgi:hypothetical protein